MTSLAAENPRASRNRLYFLIESFETDLRRNLERYLLDHVEEIDALGEHWEGAERRRKAEGADGDSIANYLDLRPCYDLLMRHKGDLPMDLVHQLRELAPRLDHFVPVRNRVMHFRPLKSDDAELSFSLTSLLAGRYWPKTEAALSGLERDAVWEPQIPDKATEPDRVLNNLPIPEYDDTGFVGRDTEVEALQKLLERGRDAVVTVTGEGGIGKTALALEVAYRIIDNPETRFDCVLWVSLKTEVLTVEGVVEISNAIRGITGAAAHLASFVKDHFGVATSQLSDLLEGLETLVVIDNLESASGVEVMALYDALPTSVRYLFTSRVGIGEVERRFPIGALARADSRRLFRKLARDRRVERLVRLSDSTVDEVLVRLRDSPLAIRWWILGVASGHEPTDRLRDQSALIAFCVRSVMDALSRDAHDMLRLLRVLAQPLTFDEIAVFMTAGMDDLRRAAQELSRGSLVAQVADVDGELARRLSLSETARSYLPTLEADPAADSEILRKYSDYIKSEERRRAEEKRGALGPNVVRTRDEGDVPAAHLLRVGLQYAKLRNIERAEQYVDRARTLNPDFWEVYRVSAFLAATNGEAARAVSMYKQARLVATSDDARAVVDYYLAGHLARAMFDLPSALPLAHSAHEALSLPQTAIQLGNLLVWNQDFDEGLAVLEAVAEPDGIHERVLLHTGIVEGRRRWAEALLDDHAYAAAFDRALSGFDDGISMISADVSDKKLHDASLRSLAAAVSALCEEPNRRTERLAALRTRLDQVESRVEGFRAATSDSIKKLSIALARFNRALSGVDEPPIDFSLGVGSTSSPRSSSPVLEQARSGLGDGDGLLGQIVNWNGRYGFIRHPDFPLNVYFHSRSLADSRDSRSLKAGVIVGFTLEPDMSEERVRAFSVWLDGN